MIPLYVKPVTYNGIKAKSGVRCHNVKAESNKKNLVMYF